METGQVRTLPSAFGLAKWSWNRSRLLLAGMLAFILLLLAALGVYAIAYSGKIYPGVKVLGVDLSGKTKQEAARLLQSRADELLESPVVLTADKHRFQVKSSDLGVNFDIQAMVNSAYQFGRSDAFASRWFQRFMAPFKEHEVTPVVALDNAKTRNALESIASTVDRPVRDAKIILGEDGPRFITSQVGVRLDVDANLKSLSNSIPRAYEKSTTVSLKVVYTRPSIKDSDLQPIYKGLVAAWNRPLTLKFGDKQWSMPVSEVRQLLRLDTSGKLPKPYLLEAPIRNWLEDISQEVDSDPVDARIKVLSQSVELMPHKDGYTLLEDQTAERIQAEAFKSGTIDVVVQVTHPNITTESLKPVVDKANVMVSQPFEVFYRNRSWTLEPQDLIQMLRWNQDDTPPTPYISRNKLRAWLSRIAERIERSPINARVTVDNGKVRIIPARIGVRLNIDTNLKALISAISSGNTRQFALQVQRWEPKIKSADLRPAVDLANQLISKPITVSYSGGSWSIDSTTLASWLHWEGKGKNITPVLDYDSVRSFVYQIAQQVNKDPSDAYLSVAGGYAHIVPETVGVAVNIESTTQKIINAASTPTRNVTLDVTTSYPQVTSDDLKPALDKMLYWAGERFYMSLDGRTWWLDPSDLVLALRWYGTGENTVVYLDESALEQQIRRWVPQDSVTNMDINYSATAQVAMKAIINGNRHIAIVAEPIKDNTNDQEHKGYESFWKGDFPTKWIDINLSSQSLAAYEGSRQVKVSLITSGRPELPTPTGLFHVLSKISPKVFISPWPKDSEWYYPPSKANFALLFRSGGYYIHDAPWRSVYGPGTNGSGPPGDARTGSHGCVNVPYSMMAWLYSWAEVGTPILIHY